MAENKLMLLFINYFEIEKQLQQKFRNGSILINRGSRVHEDTRIQGHGIA